MEEAYRKAYMIATNRETLEQELLVEGEIIDCILASNAYPGVISPQYLNSQKYVDGDLPRFFMVDTLRAKGYQHIIGVSRLIKEKKRRLSIFDLLSKTFVDDEWDKDIHKLDFLLEYDASKVGFIEFWEIPELAKEVYEQASQRKDELIKLLTTTSATF